MRTKMIIIENINKERFERDVNKFLDTIEINDLPQVIVTPIELFDDNNDSVTGRCYTAVIFYDAP